MTEAACHHGGAFWEAIGSTFGRLPAEANIINCDVLDAWFDPAPEVLRAISHCWAWQAQTSPPTHAEGLEEVIASAYGLARSSILAGAGSSDLIYCCLRSWLAPGSRVLLLEPSYGEYTHYGENVARCRVERIVLSFANSFQPPIAQIGALLSTGDYDLAVLVNPNNPTGRAIAHHELDSIISAMAPTTRLLVDEAYVDYLDPGFSVLNRIERHSNLFVLKSFSKCFALSGLRAGFLAGPSDEIQALRRHRPPWAVSLPAQIAIVAAMNEIPYYKAKWKETASLRSALATGLAELKFTVMEGFGNWVLGRTPDPSIGAARICSRASQRGLFIRDAGASASTLGDRWVRIAVKEEATQRRGLGILEECLDAAWTPKSRVVLRS